MAGAIIIGATVAQIGVLGADIVLNETDGAAFYPDIKKFVKKLDELDVEIEALRVGYRADYEEVRRIYDNTYDVATTNVGIYNSLSRTSETAEQVKDRVNGLEPIFSGRFRKSEDFKFGSPIVSDIIKYSVYGLTGVGLGLEGVALSRAFYANDLTLFRNHLSNQLKGTALNTSRLKAMNVSKLMTGMVVFGVVATVASFVYNMVGAKAKRDKLEDMVKEAEETKTSLNEEIAKLKKQKKELKGELEQSLGAYKKSFAPMIADLQTEYDEIERKNPDTTVTRDIPASLLGAQKEVDEIEKLELASDEYFEKLLASQKVFLDAVLETLAAYKEARLEVTIMAVAAPLASEGIRLSIILLSVQGLRRDMTKEELLEIIHVKLGLPDYDPREPN